MPLISVMTAWLKAHLIVDVHLAANKFEVESRRSNVAQLGVLESQLLAAARERDVCECVLPLSVAGARMKLAKLTARFLSQFPELLLLVFSRLGRCGALDECSDLGVRLGRRPLGVRRPGLKWPGLDPSPTWLHCVGLTQHSHFPGVAWKFAGQSWSGPAQTQTPPGFTSWDSPSTQHAQEGPWEFEDRA